jgi:OOP family OmpA-OmpF porin
LWVVCLLILFALGFVGYRSFHATHLWNGFIQDLKRKPGIVITDYGREDGRHYVSGLKDPLVRESEDIQATYPFQNQDLVMRWVPYNSLDPSFVLKRAEKLLTPPETVQLSFSEHCLNARGFATHDWISFFRRRAETIAGVEAVNTEGLENLDTVALDDAAKRLSAITIAFPKGSFIPLAGQEEALGRVGVAVEEIQMLSRKLGTDVQIVLVGHTDPAGAENYNRRLSKERADSILSYLVAQGITPSGLTAIGITNKIQTVSSKIHETETELQRVVTFETFYTIPEMESDKQ